MLELLKDFTLERPELGVRELARAHGLHPSSVSRLLATLADAGFVRINPQTGRYRLGFAVLELAGLVLFQLDIRSAAQPVMRELALRTQQTVNLGVLDGHEVVIIEQALSASTFRYVAPVGRRVPLHASAHGKVHLAFQTAERRAELVSAITDAQGKLPQLTKATLSTRKALEGDLAIVRARGYSINNGELVLGRLSVGVPIFDHSGVVVASIVVGGFSYEYGQEQIVELAGIVMEAGREISAEMGWTHAEYPPRHTVRKIAGPSHKATAS